MAKGATAARWARRELYRQLTYANVMSTIAVVLVLVGGSAYAASKIGPGDIAKNAVRAKHIKSNAVRTPEIADGAVTTPKLADGSVSGAKVADGAVNSAKVANNGLDAVDVSTVTGAVDQDFPSIPVNSCSVALVDAGVDIENDVISVSVSDAYTDNGMTFFAADSNTPKTFRIVVCNVTGAALDPPSATFRYVIFRR